MMAAVARLAQQQGQVNQQAAQQDGAVQAVELLVQGQGKHQAAGEDHQRDVQAHQLAGHPQRDDQCRKAQGHQDIEDIAADHAAHGNVCRVIEGGLQADGQLRCAAAHGHEGQADQ